MFWSTQQSANPLLTQVALLVLSTTAEATTSERTFSVAGTVSKKRGGGKLKRMTLSQLTLLQRVTRRRLVGKHRFTRAKRSKKVTEPTVTPPVTFPLFASHSVLAVPIAAPAVPIAVPVTPSAFAAPTPIAAAATYEIFDEFEARLQAEVDQVEAIINAGQLAFIVGAEGDVAALLQQDLLAGLIIDDPTSSDDADAVRVLDDDDDLSFDSLLSARQVGGAVLSSNHGGGAAEAVEIDSEPQVP